MQRLRSLACVVAVVAVLVPVAAARAADWPTFGHDVQRSGRNPDESALGPGAARSLAQSWATAITPPGWAVATQPLVAGGRVFVGTESGALAALDLADGHVLWRRQLGTFVPGGKRGCPAFPDMEFGISGTPVVDRARGRIYAVGGDGRAYALRLSDGAPVGGWPVQVADPAGEHVWSGLTLFGSRLYVSVAGYCDKPPYTGKVVGVDVETAKRFASWHVTRDGDREPSGGGVWGWGGVSLDPADGQVYAATGNSKTKLEDAGYSERVVRLGPRLRVRESDYPFAHPTVIDQDFGSTPMLFRPRGCPRLLTALNKDGELLVYRRHAIGAGPLQRLRLSYPDSDGDDALLGVTAYDASRRRLFVATPSDSPDGRFKRGLLAFDVDSGCRLVPAWRAPLAPQAGLTSAPVVADGVVYVANGAAGEVRAVDATTGKRLAHLALGAQAFAAPTAVDGTLLAVGYDGVVHAYRPAG